MFSSYEGTKIFRSIEQMIEHMPGFCYTMPEPENMELFCQHSSIDNNSQPDDDSTETTSLSDGEDGSVVFSSGDSDDDSGLSDGDEGSECGNPDELLCDQSGHEHIDCERGYDRLG